VAHTRPAGELAQGKVPGTLLGHQGERGIDERAAEIAVVVRRGGVRGAGRGHRASEREETLADIDSGNIGSNIATVNIGPVNIGPPYPVHAVWSPVCLCSTPPRPRP
jgi:hypothetical protein